MIKTLRPIGNSVGLILDKALLDLLKIDCNSQVEITTNGDGLYIRPLRAGHAARVRDASQAIIREQADTFRRLAE